MRRRARTRRSDADDAVADMVEQCKGVLRSNSTRRTRSVPWTPRCWR